MNRALAIVKVREIIRSARGASAKAGIIADTVAKAHRKTVVCIFAHPDDEAFGPGGTIAKLGKTKNVYLISATKGEAGKEKGKRGRADLGRARKRELLASARILGVKQVFFLGFRDGGLSNALYHKLAAKIERILKRLKPETILTYEPRGISGHIDHITVSMVSSFVFQRLPFVKRLLQYCVPAERMRRRKGYFIYVPPGYEKKDIDLVVDVRGVWDKKIRAIEQHRSQITDMERIKAMLARFPKTENFLVIRKRG